MLERCQRQGGARRLPSTRLRIACSLLFLLRSSVARRPFKPARDKPYGCSRTLWSRWNQEKKGGARGGAQGSSAASSCGSETSSRTGPEAVVGQRKAGAAPEIAGPRSAL